MFSKITSRISKLLSVFDKLGFGSNFEFRSKPSLITVICMDPHSPNKISATKYCFLILGNDSRFFSLIDHFLFFVFFLVILCYFVIINFNKTYVIIIILFNSFFFHESYFYIFMFRDVPACFGMFRNVPCSGFHRRPTNFSFCLLDMSEIVLYVCFICSSSISDLKNSEAPPYSNAITTKSCYLHDCNKYNGSLYTRA